MRSFLLLAQMTLLSFLTIGAKSHVPHKNTAQNKEIKFLALKLKKEMSDKKLSPLKKYTLAILAARELNQIGQKNEALEFYEMAKDIKVEENKLEIHLAIAKKQNPTLFFYDVEFKKLIQNKLYERALLSMDPDTFLDPTNARYKIIYDMLNVKIRKRAVKKLYCFSDFQKNPEDYQYSNLLCDLLIDYLKSGKIDNSHIKVVEEYFFKYDLAERYLLQLARDL